ncbi:MAG: class I SAM-dependent methyltransferase [Pseudomonadota bacterium]
MLIAEMWRHFFAHPTVDLSRFDQPLKVLEPMCGTCEGRKILKENFDIELAYKGFDYAANMVALAKEAYPDAEIWQDDATKIDGSAHSVDVVMIAGGIHHVSAQAADVVDRLSQALRPGGLFIVAEPTHNNPLLRWVREFIYRRNRAFDAETERGFTTGELDQFFIRAGLTPVRKSYPTLLAYVLWGCPEAFPALDRGPLWLARSWTRFERLFWNTSLAKWAGFGTFAAYRKDR